MVLKNPGPTEASTACRPSALAVRGAPAIATGAMVPPPMGSGANRQADVDDSGQPAQVISHGLEEPRQLLSLIADASTAGS